MKRFEKYTPENSPFTTENVLKQVCAHPGEGQSLNVEQIRSRIKILDAIEADKEHVELDDKLHTELCAMLNSFSFAQANRDLLRVIDGVLGAENIQTH